MQLSQRVDAGLFWPGFVSGLIVGACLSQLDGTGHPQPKARPVTSEDLADAIEDMERRATTPH